MGALAPISSFIPEDDLLLKNAIEAGASLESLAKGAVQFSRRFTVRELQDRWYSILYDPIVSAEASAHMIEVERSASNPPSKSHRFINSNENNCVLGKRKAESVRTSYYAMRKRISSEPFNPMDLNFFVGPSSDNCNWNEDECPADCMLGDHGSNHYRLQELNEDAINHDFSQTAIDGVDFGGKSSTVHTRSHGKNFSIEPNSMHNENTDIYGEDFPISGLEELLQSEPDNLFQANDLDAQPISSFHHSNRDPGNISPEFGGSQVFNSPISDYDLSFQDVRSTSPANVVPIWRAIEGISAPSMPIDVNHSEEDQVVEDALALLNDDEEDDNDVKNGSVSGQDVVHPGSEITDEVPLNKLQSSHAVPEEYFRKLSNSLLDLSNEEELMIMNDGEDVIHKSYYNGLSSLLSSPPQDVNGDHASSMPDLEVSVPAAHLVLPGSACPGESSEYGGSHDTDGNISCNSDVLMLSSAPAINPQIPDSRDEYMCCAFNMEDPDIPCNDDIFPLNETPLSSTSMVPQSFLEPLNPMSSSYKDISDICIPSERGPGLLTKEPENLGLPRLCSQKMALQKVRETGLDHPFGDSLANHGFSNNNSQHVGSRSAGIACGNRSQTSSVNARIDAPASLKLKEESLEIQLAKPAGCDSSQCSTQINARYSKLEVDARSTPQNNQVLHAKLLADTLITQPAVNPLTSDQEESPCESDDELPYFSDVEAMILDMDLGPNGQDIHSSSKASTSEHEETKKAIVRLEQVAHSCMQRAIASHGAFAILYGRHSKHYIKKPEILLGRATEDVKVDIDLGREGHGNRISRRQATIKMDDGGSFNLTNLGKFSVSVNEKEIVSGENVSLDSGCLVEIRGMPFIFESNWTCVKQYLDKVTKKSQTQQRNV